MTGDKKMPFIVAMLRFFGKLPGQTTSEFSAEIKALTDEDRKYFTAGLEQNGYTITLDTRKPAAA